MKKTVTKVMLSIMLLFGVLGFIGVNAPKTEVEASPAYSNRVEELRAVWVSTVWNIDIDEQVGTSEAAILKYQNNFKSIIARALTYGMNAIFFQVRPMNDAFYNSKYNPWSAYMAGRGVNPGWDPLAWMVAECHEKGIELHAWLNPYRASTDTGLELSDSLDTINKGKLSYARSLKGAVGSADIDNPMLDLSDEKEFLQNIVLSGDGQLILNPAKERTINHVTNTVKELITNYEIDGIHFDDYFYPGEGMEGSIEITDYNAYRTSGGTLSMDDWRRDNVNRMVKSVSDVVKEHNETSGKNYCAFGISPAPVWAPGKENCNDASRSIEGGMKVSCGSYSTYFDLFADTKLWVESEWIDYIIPQAYTRLDDQYKIYANWWSNIVAKTDVKLYMGTALYRVGSDDWQNSSEMGKQLNYIYTNTLTSKYVTGFTIFSYRNLLSSDTYIKSASADLYNSWRKGALAPVYIMDTTSPAPKAPTTKVYKTNTSYYLCFNEVENANGYAVYRFAEDSPIDFESATPSRVINQSEVGNLQKISVTHTAAKGYKYVLRTYDKNNQAIEDYQVFDMTNAIENQAPEVSLVDWNETREDYPLNETITVKIKVIEDLDLQVSAKIETSLDGNTFSKPEDMKMLDDETYIYEFTPKEVIRTKACFRITVSDGDKSTTITTNSFTCGTANLKRYTITFDTDGGTLIEPQTVIEGMRMELPTPPVKKGYKFVEWRYNGLKFNTNMSINSDLTLVAYYEVDENLLVVSFDTDGGTDIEDIYVESGETIKAPKTPTRSGYKFNGWYLDDVKFDFNTEITESITLTAKWTAVGSGAGSCMGAVNYGLFVAIFAMAVIIRKREN